MYIKVFLPHSDTPTITPATVSVSISQSVTFLCEVSGMVTPNITWYNGTTEITADTPRVVLTSSTLTLQDIVREDQGEYTCRATFSEGSTQATAMLFVNGKE